MLVSNNKAWMDKARFYATHAKEDAPYYEHHEVGYNYRMSNILAAVGVAQLEVVEQRVQQCQNIFNWYQEELSEVSEITFMPELQASAGNRWLTTLCFNKTNPDKVIEYLKERNIESRRLWKPMHLQALFKDALCERNGVSETLFNTGICLPSGTQLTQDNVMMISQHIKDALQ